jgi:hypothetical protein
VAGKMAEMSRYCQNAKKCKMIWAAGAIKMGGDFSK